MYVRYPFFNFLCDEMSERFNSNKKYDDMQQRAIKKGNTPIHSGFELLEIMLETRGRFIFGDLKFCCLCV